jgi:hypothetical protein
MAKRSQSDSQLYSPRATLAALGLRLRSLKLMETISRHVSIKQKKIRHSPLDKLTDAFIAILSGAHGLSEINTRVRPDAALQRAFGRTACAEQSVVQETLDHCTAENVRQMQAAVDEIFRTHSQAYRHDYKKRLQLLDLDLTGMPCGPTAEQSMKGYFGRNNIRSGRQMGRVSAALYSEVVVDQLYPGNLQLRDTLPHLIAGMERSLELDEAKRRRTLLRIDSGGGSFSGVNYLLKRGYQLHCKDYSSRRAANLAKYVREWQVDPLTADRQLGWIVAGSPGYVREVRRLIVKWKKRNGQICHSLLLSTLSPREVLDLLGWPLEKEADPLQVLAAYMKLYDLRGGSVEIDIKQSKQGIGITKRNKKRYDAQQMVMLLGTLAHNVTVWAKGWLQAEAPKLEKYGVQRMVRDVFGVSGFIEVGGACEIKRIVLNRASNIARQCAKPFRELLKREHVSVILAET